jgi:hypothetical protein
MVAKTVGARDDSFKPKTRKEAWLNGLLLTPLGLLGTWAGAEGLLAPGHRWIGALFLLGGLSLLTTGVVGWFHTSDRNTTIWNEATEPYLKKVGATFGKVIWWVVKLAFFGAAIALTVWIANGAYEAMSLKALAGIAVALLVYIAFFRE